MSDEVDYEIPAANLPPGFADSIAKDVADPVTPRPAATIVLLKDGPDGAEVLLLRRNRQTGFVPGAYVFPGGRVDSSDGDGPSVDRWLHLTPDQAASRLGLPQDAEPPPIAYYTAAVREAFEETGLLVGTAESHRTVEPGEPLRERLMDGSGLFDTVLVELDVHIDGHGVEYIAHWITPRVEPRRYDTRFFAARVEEDAVAAIDEREMTDAVWLTARAALERHHDGRLPMIFPTIRTLEDLQDLGSVEETLEHFRGEAVAPKMPEIVRTERGVGLRIP